MKDVILNEVILSNAIFITLTMEASLVDLNSYLGLQKMYIFLFFS